MNAKDVRHLQGVSEAVGAILQSQEACPALWLPYLSHRDCSARAHLERIHYLLENPQICAERFYYPLLQKVLSAFASSSLTLAFEQYGERFGGIEPHFKDYKSAGFDLARSRIRDAQRLTSLVMLLDIAHLIAVIVGILVVQAGHRARLDWHGERGLSFLQLGLREIARRCYQRLCLPTLTPLPLRSPPKAYAMKHFQQYRESLIEFSRVVTFS